MSNISLFNKTHCFFIAALPEEGPRITGGRPRYQIGDVVRVNCSSGRSKPAAHLTWYINGDPADSTLLRSYDPVITGREGLETSILGLEFRVKQRHFRRGDMKLKVCHRLIVLLLYNPGHVFDTNPHVFQSITYIRN